MSGVFEVKAVERYRAPRYPRFGHAIPASSRPPLLARIPLPKLALALAGGSISLAASGCGALFPPAGGEIAPSCVADVELSEAEARAVLRAAFEARGLSITEDFAFAQGEAAFMADGHDPAAGVGYDYQDEAERLADFDQIGERDEVLGWLEADGPFFLILDAASGCQWDYESDDAAARERLQQSLRWQAEEFLGGLEAQGHL